MIIFIIIFGLIVSLVMFLLVFLVTIFVNDITLVEGFYISLIIGSIGFMAVVIVSISDKLRYLRQKNGLSGELMFEMLISMLREELPHISSELECDKYRVIKIFCPCDDIGEITISTDPQDVIVGVGDLFHVHIRIDWTGENEDPEAAAISEAIKYIKDVMADKVIVRQKYRDEKLVSACAFYADDSGGSGWVAPLTLDNILGALLRRKTKIKDYVWSGPYERDC